VKTKILNSDYVKERVLDFLKFFIENPIFSESCNSRPAFVELNSISEIL
jgi:hypothetical protein